MRAHKISKQKGFSLIEVLVTTLILAFGLLGMAGLQTVSLRNNVSAYERSQAVFLAYDITDRMRANRSIAVNGGYNVASSATSATVNLANALAQDDVKDWLDLITTTLPAGDGSVSCPSASSACQVDIYWDEARTGGNLQNFQLKARL